MKTMVGISIAFIIVGLTMIFTCSCSKAKDIKTVYDHKFHDNPAEEYIEKMLEEHAGIELEITPDHGEDK